MLNHTNIPRPLTEATCNHFQEPLLQPIDKATEGYKSTAVKSHIDNFCAPKL